MKITITNTEAVERAVKERMDKVPQAFSGALEVEKERIKARTQSGNNVNGSQMTPGYSSSWRRVRLKNNLQTRYVDLTFTGDMFKALRTAFTKTGSVITGTIFFQSKSDQEKAHWNQAEPGRRFMGLSKEQIEIIKSKIRNVV